MECYDRSTPVKYNQYTKFHLSDAGIDCVNLVKSYVNATMTYHMKLNNITGTSITNTDPGRQMFYKMFVGLKNFLKILILTEFILIIIKSILKKILFMNKHL